MEEEKLKFKNDFKKRTYNWVLKLIWQIEKLPKDLTSGVISKQLIRSATSVVANYTEASSASSRKDFINFFTYSLKSANESKLWINMLIDTNRGDREEFTVLLDELVEISNILAKSILTLKAKK
jgi:four helix bundle protein